VGAGSVAGEERPGGEEDGGGGVTCVFRLLNSTGRKKRDEATPFGCLHSAGSVPLGPFGLAPFGLGILMVGSTCPHRPRHLHYGSATDLPLLVSTPLLLPVLSPRISAERHVYTMSLCYALPPRC
jgi:hypothetical protein